MLSRIALAASTLLLIGVQPCDRFMHPSATEHVIQTAVANAILLVMLVWNWSGDRVNLSPRKVMSA